MERALSRWEEFFGFEDFGRFTVKKAMDFKKHLENPAGREKPLSANSRHHCLRRLCTFFQWLSTRMGYKTRLTPEAISYLSLDKKTVQTLSSTRPKKHPTLDYVKRLVDSIRIETEIDRRDRALIAFLLPSGMRDKAVVSLPLGCFDPVTLEVRQYPKKGVDTTVLVIAGDGTLADSQIVDIVIDFSNVAPEIDSPGDTVHHARLTYFAYYPQISDADDSMHEVSYLSWPHWCDTPAVNDSVTGTSPHSVFFESLPVVVRDVCNADILSPMVHVYLCGDVNNDGGQIIDVSDLVYLVEYMFNEGPPPPVMEAGDCDGSGEINIADLAYLVSCV